MDITSIITAIQDLETQNRALRTQCDTIATQLTHLKKQWPIVGTPAVKSLRACLVQRVDEWLDQYPDFVPIRPTILSAGYHALFHQFDIPELKALPVDQMAQASQFWLAWQPDANRLWFLLIRHTIRERIRRALQRRTITRDEIPTIRRTLWQSVGATKHTLPDAILQRQKLLTRLQHQPLHADKRPAKRRQIS
ncbi:hypothetical protein [Sulfobacillus thermosulfidooxidans]|uniref:hypothetical protein n=1 Tax=Sulfobacillus thermosulfidooxidans TaxID=28034 RepID=UPI0006B663BE|nr:hypothetical protein [Sulfobacillus thermosulfidooxidans]